MKLANLTIESQKIRAHVRTLNARWTCELERDLEVMHGIFISDPIIKPCKLLFEPYINLIGLASYHERAGSLESILLRDKHGFTVKLYDLGKACVSFDLTVEEQKLAAERYFEELL